METVLPRCYKANLPKSLAKLFFLLLLLIAASYGAANAEKAAKAVASQTNTHLSSPQIKAKIEELNAKEGVAEELKAQLLPLYQSALDNLSGIEANSAKMAEYEAALKAAPEKTRKLQREIEQQQQKLAKQTTEDISGIPNAELEHRLVLEKEKITAIDGQIKKLDAELSLQNDRPQRIRQETIVAQQALEEGQKKLAAFSVQPASKEAEAKKIQLSTLLDARSAELKMLSAEANSNLVRVGRLQAELQLAKIQKEMLLPTVTAIETLVNERKQLEAIHLEHELSQAERTAYGKHSLIQQVTRENIQYSRDLQAITSKIDTYKTLKEKVETRAGEIESDYKSAEKKISLAGLSPVLGKILREQRRNLYSQKQFLNDSEAIQNETAVTSLEQFKVDDKLKSLANLDSYLDGLMKRQVDKAIPTDERVKIQAELRDLLASQIELLGKLSATDTAYLRALGDFDFAKQQMLAQTNKYAGYLDEHLLWVRSSAPINTDYLSGLYHAISWLLSPLNWAELIKDTAIIAWKNILLTLLAILGMAILPMIRNWAKAQLVVIADKIQKIYTDNFNYTLKALAYTLILVLPLPLFVYFWGWYLSGNWLSAEFSKAVGIGLKSTAIPLFVLQYLYRLFASNGIAERHFHWQKTNTKLLHKQVAWLRFVVVLGVFIINSTGALALSNHSDHLGRLALIIVMAAMAVFFARLLRPSSGLLQGYIESRPDDWFVKLRYIWYPVIVAIPLVISGFAVAGYYLSALELQQKLVVSVRLIFVLVIIYELVIRWLTFVNRKLALKNAKQKRKAAALSEKLVTDEGVAGDDPALPVDEQLIDIPTINAQTIKLLVMFIGFSLIVGFWMVWSNILPAFSFLDRIELWHHLALVDNQETYQPVTLKNLLMVGLFLFVIVVAVRNFPGLMELLVFSRLSIAAGGRYAVNQLAKYLIISIGFICIANQLGGSWSQVQWLVAALSVGLGFGLQEIFANLVSGIILLFERPIRVGDTVTISGVTGKVSRIQMRATTLIDWDQKELIVPNKTFITSQLVNWTLSDTTSRIVIPVTIAYGSDVELTHRVMMEAIKHTAMILTDPAPAVIFTGFGENGLDFSVRVFVSELAHRLPVTHNLLVNLEKALRENNIDMPAALHDRQVPSRKLP